MALLFKRLHEFPAPNKRGTSRVGPCFGNYYNGESNGKLNGHELDTKVIQGCIGEREKEGKLLLLLWIIPGKVYRLKCKQELSWVWLSSGLGIQRESSTSQRGR